MQLCSFWKTKINFVFVFYIGYINRAAFKYNNTKHYENVMTTSIVHCVCMWQPDIEKYTHENCELEEIHCVISLLAGESVCCRWQQVSLLPLQMLLLHLKRPHTDPSPPLTPACENTHTQKHGCMNLKRYQKSENSKKKIKPLLVKV